MSEARSATGRDLAAFVKAHLKRKVVPLRPPRRPVGTRTRTHIVIPDRQHKPWAPIEQAAWAGAYIAERRPDVVIDLGDAEDMPAANNYASASEMEGSTIADDIACARDGWRLLTEQIHKPKGYRPELHALKGNHTDHLDRLIRESPRMRGLWGDDPFDVKASGWKPHTFLQPVDIDGVAYCHFFPRGPNGKVTQSHRGAPNALAMVKREMKSCVAGHMQGLDTAIYHTSERTIRGVIAGSFYAHLESYRSPMQSTEWHGLLVFHEVQGGNFDIMEVSFDYLRRKYGRRFPLKPWMPKA